MDRSRMLLSVSDYEQYASGKIDSAAEGYLYTGCSDEQTLHDNVAAFARYRFRPRVLQDVSNIDMSTTVLGHPVSCPVGVAPMAMCCLAHPDGELGIAKACEHHGIPFGLSTVASVSMEDIAARAPNSARWFQLYITKERRLTESLVRRAEAAGFSALILTVDNPIAGRRLSSLRQPLTVPENIRLANIDKEGMLTQHKQESASASFLEIMDRQLDQSVTWNDVTWLINFSRLPVIVKGVITGENAREAVSHGVAAIWVSNHGGRQLDGVPATLDVLSEVVDAVAGRCEVYVDGGVRSGYDVTKAVALGASAVFIGRPALWGLVYKGTEGVVSLLQLLKDEMENAMALLGVRCVHELTRSHVIHHSLIPKM